MSRAGLEPKYMCDACGDVHDFEDDAADCCRPKIVLGYQCPVCRDFHPREEAALDCCADLAINGGVPPMPTAAELEAAGQLRLLP